MTVTATRNDPKTVAASVPANTDAASAEPKKKRAPAKKRTREALAVEKIMACNIGELKRAAALLRDGDADVAEFFRNELAAK